LTETAQPPAPLGATSPALALEAGDRCLAAGERDQAILLWTEALARAEDPALRTELAGRLARLHRRAAARRFLLPALALAVGLPALAALGATLGQRAEARRLADAEAALTDARDLIDQDPQAAAAALGAVVQRYPGTAAAERAADLGRDVRDHASEARLALEDATAHLERRDPGAAVARLDAALESDRFPTSRVTRQLERLRAEAAQARDLQRATEALQAQDYARAVELFEEQDAPEAKRGSTAARLARHVQAGQAALEGGELGRALDELRAANGYAAQLGRPERDLAPLEARWSELRRVRALLAFHQAAGELAEGDASAAAARLAAVVAPDEEELRQQLDALAALAAVGVPDRMLLVPAGAYVRGDVLQPDELPLLPVEVGSFLIDRREVSQADYARFLKATDHPAPAGWRAPQGEADGARPVTGVRHADAAAYAAWAGKRLPTEDEWEAAARLEPFRPTTERDVAARARFLSAFGAGLREVNRWAEAEWTALGAEAVARGERPALDPAGLAGPTSPEVSDDAVRVSPRAAFALLEARRWPWGGFWDAERCRLGTVPHLGGAAGASPLGVEDLAGGVSEWTASEYRPYAGPLRGPGDGKGRRVVRGGSFRSLSGEVRTAYRAAFPPSVAFDDLGFRCARDLPKARR
jgi:formylglycine-generating enzyme required for sulfatase activity